MIFIIKNETISNIIRNQEYINHTGYDFTCQNIIRWSVQDGSGNDVLGMDKPEPVAKVCYAQMVKQFLSRDPFECVLCGGRMVYRRAIAGLNVSGLKKNARDISLLRYMPA